MLGPSAHHGAGYGKHKLWRFIYALLYGCIFLGVGNQIEAWIRHAAIHVLWNSNVLSLEGRTADLHRVVEGLPLLWWCRQLGACFLIAKFNWQSNWFPLILDLLTPSVYLATFQESVTLLNGSLKGFTCLYGVQGIHTSASRCQSGNVIWSCGSRFQGHRCLQHGWHQSWLTYVRFLGCWSSYHTSHSLFKYWGRRVCCRCELASRRIGRSAAMWAIPIR
jgi:hypothetical protein